MNSGWHEVRVGTPVELLDAISNFLFELGATGLVEEERGQDCVLTAYFASQPELSKLAHYLQALGFPAHGAIEHGTVVEEDWSESWKSAFAPFPVGERLWIHPPWAPAVPENRTAVCIEPGMAFGTGQHPSTLGCLTLIERALAPRVAVERALDLGTGTGILAIALALLGVRRVVAADTDATARNVAAENVQRNPRAAGRICIVEGWQELAPFDLTVANLYADVLCELAPLLTTVRRGAGSSLIVSGYLSCDRGRLETAFTQHGWELVETWSEEDWVAQHFCFRG